ncbi:hypothetical protein V6N11_013585 [Hibiscus sabdariffa]|uniref:Uncharacterized protein n=2 Tax=Hibiscus sabdariffa TaxID=183260 RepID=A0ABR1ZMS0_9ROSI
MVKQEQTHPLKAIHTIFAISRATPNGIAISFEKGINKQLLFWLWGLCINQSTFWGKERRMQIKNQVEISDALPNAISPPNTLVVRIVIS